MGTLFLVATPIGNLEDITFRAVRILREAALIAAEDTRTTRILLDRYEIATPTTSYHEHTSIPRSEAILAALETGDVALVSDAGTPGVNDPGYELVVAAIARGHAVSPIPGACAAVAALAASGLPTDQFIFAGFAPRKKSALSGWVAELRSEQRTTIVYESPHRVEETLRSLAAAYPGRSLCIAREITKRFEEFWRGTCADAVAHVAEQPARGEYVLVIGGAAEPEVTAWEIAEVEAALRERLKNGYSGRDAAAEVANLSGWPRREVVRLVDAVKYTAAN
jgi:16S rRNA (cytidine1402-2'-O)-methyltransferase